MGEAGDCAEVGEDPRRTTARRGRRRARPVARERLRDALGRDPDGQAGRGVDLGPHPDRLEPGEHEPREDRLVQVPRHDHRSPGPARRERERLVSLRRAVDAEAAEIGAPERRGEPLRLAEQVPLHVEVVGAGRQGEVVVQHVVGEVRGALVARRRERRDRRSSARYASAASASGRVGLIHARFLPRPRGPRPRERAAAARGRAPARAPER